MASLMRQRRATIDVDINAASKKVSTWHSKVFAKPPTLLNHDQVPAYCQDNPYILSGYRPISNSFSACWSSWLYLHNESLNIYTHLIPAVAFLATEAVMVTYLDSFYPDASAKDHLVFGFFLATSVTCMIASATYHTVMSHSHEVENLFLRFDFVGIVVQILGNFVSGVYMGFYCEPQLQKLYWTMVSCAQLLLYYSLMPMTGTFTWRRISRGTGQSEFPRRCMEMAARLFVRGHRHEWSHTTGPWRHGFRYAENDAIFWHAVLSVRRSIIPCWDFLLCSKYCIADSQGKLTIADSYARITMAWQIRHLGQLSSALSYHCRAGNYHAFRWASLRIRL